MKILYTNFHRGDGGGHTTYILSLARALQGSHEIVVAAPSTSRLHQVLLPLPGVRVQAYDFRGGLLKAVCNAHRFRAFLQSERFDVIHVNGSADHRLCMLATAGMGADCPAIVYTQHNDRVANRLGAVIRARFGTTRVICVCEHSRRRLAVGPFGRCGLTTVHNGVDVDAFAPVPPADITRLRKRWIKPRSAGSLVVGSNAGTAPYKRWLDMVEGVALLPKHLRDQVLILIAGVPPSGDQVSKVVQLGMSDSVVFAGLLDDVRPFIAALDVGFVLSSELETISFACREMMSMGVPVVVSDSGGLQENVEPHRDGWVVPARNPCAIARTLTDILSNRHCLIPMRTAAREKAVAEFSLPRFTAGTLDVYLAAKAARDLQVRSDSDRGAPESTL